MWMKWDDVEVKVRVENLRDGYGELLGEDELRKREFCVVKSPDDLDVIEGTNLEIVSGDELQPWSRDDLMIVAEWYRPSNPPKGISVHDEEKSADFPFIIARKV